MVKVKKRKKKKLTWQQVVLIILVLLMALALVFSRGQRAARRIHIPAPAKEQSDLPLRDAITKKDDATWQDTVNGKDVAADEIVTASQKYATEKGEADVYVNNSSVTNRRSDFEITDSQIVNNAMDISREQLLGLITPSSDDDFVLIDAAYASRPGMYLRRAAYEAFLEMRAAAQADGITLTILSATRDFNHQKRIWEDKWFGRQALHGNILATDIEDPRQRALEILRFSAMPGTSRHHWGTDIDLNNLVNSYFESGEGKRVYEWLLENAAKHGFCQPYTRHGDERTGGYEEEKWHWSYLPLANSFYRTFKNKISYHDIKGFAGHETARELHVIERFVLDVNSLCLPRE